MCVHAWFLRYWPQLLEDADTAKQLKNGFGNIWVSLLDLSYCDKEASYTESNIYRICN
jgi:hypothetical protein